MSRTKFNEVMKRVEKLASASALLDQNGEREAAQTVLAESRTLHDNELAPLVAHIDLDELFEQYRNGLISKPEFIAHVQLRD